jgi:hypothetical protein
MDTALVFAGQTGIQFAQGNRATEEGGTSRTGFGVEMITRGLR